MPDVMDALKFALPGTFEHPIVGPEIASAGTIAVTHMIHNVTGTTEIDTITPPYDGFAGIVILNAIGAFDLGNDGNIALEVLDIVAGQAVMLCYNPVTAKWYPLPAKNA